MIFRSPAPPSLSVLFVCAGNICRSPTAEGVFRAAASRGAYRTRIHVDSAGIGNWYAGSPPDRRAVQAARRRGYDLSGLRARQVTVGDFGRYGWILAMDRSNLAALQQLRPLDYPGRLALLLDFVPEVPVREVPDPYYGGPEGFEHVLDLIEQASAALLAEVQGEIPPT